MKCPLNNQKLSIYLIDKAKRLAFTSYFSTDDQVPNVQLTRALIILIDELSHTLPGVVITLTPEERYVTVITKNSRIYTDLGKAS